MGGVKARDICNNGIKKLWFYNHMKKGSIHEYYLSNHLIMHLSMLSPTGGRGGTPGIRGAFDFSEEFLVPSVGPQNLVKSDQLSPGVRSIYIENE